MSQLTNNLGTFTNVAALWQAYPEGGNEGDTAIVNGLEYHWDKFTRTWITEPEAKVIEVVQAAVAAAADIPETESEEADNIRLNYLGEFESLTAVWENIPEGGYEGDYVTILGVPYDWNIYTFNWGDAGDIIQDPARPNQEFPHDVTIDYDLTVAGPIRARAIFGRLRGTADHAKTADYAEKAKTADYALHAPQAGTSEIPKMLPRLTMQRIRTNGMAVSSANILTSPSGRSMK